jgi:aspartate/methionine/tyrosine aminotransferase
VREDEAARLLRFCRDEGLALISDEVFLDYQLRSSAEQRALSIFDASPDALAFTLGGFSKTLALPQLKLGWIATSGPAALVRDSMERLDLIADTFLTVNTPVQHAARDLLDIADIVQPLIRERCARNLRGLLYAARESAPARCLPVEAGWYAVLALDDDAREEDLVCGLLEERNVIAHPGYFFDFPEGKHLVLSLLTEEAAFGEGISRLFEYLRRTP